MADDTVTDDRPRPRTACEVAGHCSREPGHGVHRTQRLLVVGSEVIAAARFQARGEEWRSNAARGGTAEAADPDDRAVEIAIAATEATGLGICGVDLLPGRDGAVVGEVNPTPGFIGLEAATGVDVASAVIGHMLSLAG